MSAQLPLLNDNRFHQFKPSRKSTLLNNYDPTAYPPDLQFAANHGLSQRVGHRIPMLQDVERCRCCLEPIRKEQLPLLCDLAELCHCGQSTPLYFVFVKQCILLLAFNAVILMIPSVLVNYLMGEECSVVNGAGGGFLEGICKGSVINVMNVEVLDALQMQAVLNFVAVLSNILLIGYLQLKMEEQVAEMGKQANASDYSFMIKGLPADITISEIQKYVQDKLLYSGAPNLVINKIYLIYNFKEYLLLVQKKQSQVQRLIKLKQELVHTQHKNLKSTNYQQKLELQKNQTELNYHISHTENSIQQTEIQINKFQVLTNELTLKLRNEGVLETENNKTVLNFSGKVIVTLNDPRSKQVILQSWDSRSCFQRFAYRLSELLEGQKSKIMLSAAPDPADIIFANMGTRKKMVWKSRILYSLLIVVLLLLDFLIVALCKKFLKEEKALQQGNIIFSFVNSIIVSLFCSLFRGIIRNSQRQSCYNTYSKLSYQSVAKLVIIFQINMLLTTFVANVASFYLVRQDKPTFQGFPLNFQSFLYDIFFLIATNPLFSLILVILDHRHFRNLIKRYRIKQGWLAVSQSEANLCFQNINFDLCHKYSTIYRFLIFTAGIASVFPLSILICLVALSILYWLDKYLLLRRYSVTTKITTRFTLLVQKIMSQFPIYLSLTNFVVMFIPIQDGRAFKEEKYSKAYYYLSVIALSVSFFNYMLGNSWLKKILRMAVNKRQREEQSPPVLYKQIQNLLENDYSHNYPYFRVSKKIGQEQGSESIRKDKLKELRENQRLGVFEVIKYSMHQDRYTE